MICAASHILIDAIINHPTVRPTVQEGDERLSSYGLVREGAVGYADDKGCLLFFVPKGNDVWEGHVFAVSGSRGKNAVLFGLAAIGRLFTDHRAVKMVAAAPLSLPAVRVYCRRLGLKPVGRDSQCAYYETEAGQWAE